MTTPDYADEHVTLYKGDCREVLPTLPNASVDAVVTDPPYELGFMGKGWDASGIAYNVDLWCHALRILKPGGHLLAFGGTRTYHRLTCAIEDAGFEIRDSIAWLYASGFPKSLDVSKAIDKAAGAERQMRPGGSDGAVRKPRAMAPGGTARQAVQTLSDPVTEAAVQWAGWGTALKPASEPIVVARKPLSGTVAANVLAHGTGALNIDACRVGDGAGVVTFDRHPGARSREEYRTGTVANARPSAAGRWPPNVVLSHAEECADDGPCVEGCPVAELDAQSAGASRFFQTFRYEAKADSSERPKVAGVAHPTVKPLALMQWLVKLVTPPGGTVLDLFAGSGTTVEACLREGFRCFAVEREGDYLPLIEERIRRTVRPWQPSARPASDAEPTLFDDFGGAA